MPGFYVYESLTGQGGARVHLGECPYCRNGKGRANRVQEPRTGMWHGPYETHSAAKRKGRRLIADLSRHPSSWAMATTCKKCRP